MSSTEIHKTDVIIVGAGPVGLFAIFECGMLGMRCHVVDSLETVGGQCRALYPEKPIYDIPGFPEIEASALIDNLEKQAAPFAPVFHLNQRAESLTRTSGGRWRVTTSQNVQIEAAAVILAGGPGAFGPNRPPLPGLAAYEGTSVFYLVRNRQDFKGARIVIAGGGDSAVDWALSLCEIASHVFFVHRRDKFRAAPETVSRLEQKARDGQVEFVIPCQLKALHGQNGRLQAVEVEDLDGKPRLLEADYLLPFFGIAADLGPLANWGLALDRNHVVTEPTTAATNLPGIFAIGDIAAYPNKKKLILTGFSEAAFAAHAIHPLVFPGTALHFEHSTTKGVPHRQEKPC